MTRKIVLILCSLALVDCAITIARRVAVGLKDKPFKASSVLLVNEIIKCTFALARMYGRSATTGYAAPFTQHLHLTVRYSIHMLPVCMLYLVANLISYPSLARIPSSVFAAISQLKVLSTAFFTVLLLGKNISLRKWRTLSIMVLGVIVVTLANQPTVADSRTINTSYILGALLAIFQTLMTGGACVTLEKLLKSSGQSGHDGVKFDVWDRNIQLAIWSIAIYAGAAQFEGEGAFFEGWDFLVMAIAIMHALGGILVALSILHASSIAKTIAVCAGLVLTALLGGFFGDGRLTGTTLAGSMIVALSILTYKDDSELDSESASTASTTAPLHQISTSKIAQ